MPTPNEYEEAMAAYEAEIKKRLSKTRQLRAEIEGLRRQTNIALDYADAEIDRLRQKRVLNGGENE